MCLFSEPDKVTRCQDAQILASSFKVIPLKKKSSNIKFNSLCFLPDVCFKKYNKQDRLLCLCRRYNGPNLPHLCLYWHLSHASFYH